VIEIDTVIRYDRWRTRFLVDTSEICFRTQFSFCLANIWPHNHYMRSYTPHFDWKAILTCLNSFFSFFRKFFKVGKVGNGE